MTILPKGRMVSYKWRTDDRISGHSVTALFLPPSVLDSLAHESSNSKPMTPELIPSSGVQDSMIYDIARQLSSNIENPSLMNSIYSEIATQLFAVHILKYYCTHHYKIKNYKKRLPRKTILKITQFIKDNIARQISLLELASVARLSEYHFARLFKKSIGISPYQYIIQCRIERAKELLSRTNFSITHIATDLSFHDASNFSKAFRKATGFTPSEFRKKFER